MGGHGSGRTRGKNPPLTLVIIHKLNYNYFEE